MFAPYAFFVWGAYATALVVVGWMIVSTLIKKKK
ncbi:MAG: heme exporter protein CcmD [Alphaproteobacteria bacterium]|nr:heme exporter protein CcmD [Alphaproteobacteria bacterium]